MNWIRQGSNHEKWEQAIGTDEEKVEAAHEGSAGISPNDEVRVCSACRFRRN
jgi:hypothetical protein